LAAIRNEEIAKQAEATDGDVMAVAQKQIKQRREAAEAYRKGRREELAQKEEAEIKILSTFLPQQLSAEEVKKIAQEVIGQMPDEEKNNFGKVMGQVMAQVKGKTDGNNVVKAVKELLD
jgi:hypothetical protein